MESLKKVPWQYSFTAIAVIMAVVNFIGHITGAFLEVRFWFPFVGRGNYLVLYHRPFVADVWAYLVVWVVAGGLLIYDVYFGKSPAVRWAATLIILCLLGVVVPNFSALLF